MWNEGRTELALVMPSHEEKNSAAINAIRSQRNEGRTELALVMPSHEEKKVYQERFNII